MSVGTRLIAMGILMLLGGLVYLGSLAGEARLWDERSGIRSLESRTAATTAQRTRSAIDAAIARQLSLEAAMTHEEYSRTSRRVAYGLVAIGALLGLIGIAFLYRQPSRRRGFIRDEAALADFRSAHPWTKATLPDFQSGFAQAVAFTRALGFSVPFDRLGTQDVIDEKNIDRMTEGAGDSDFKRSAGQCLKWSHFLAPVLERQLPVRCCVTVGQVWKDDAPVFGPTWLDLERWATQGIGVEDFHGRGGINCHAWITLESGEVVDPSLFSTLARLAGGGFERIDGGVVWGRDPDVVPQHRYVPMLLGDAAVNAIQSHTEFPLLARSAEELGQLPIVFVRER